MESHLNHPKSKERIKILKKFKGKLEPSIDIGSGGFMPFVLKTTHACDKSALAKKYLKKLGWKGNFMQVDARYKLPYADKQFRVAICSEVIEHFRKKSEVMSLFKEIDRISNSWIVTTPSIFIPDRDHHLFFVGGTIYEYIPFRQDYFIVINKDKTLYISNSISKLKKVLNIENGKR
jgi:hypothetical protein